MQPPPLLTPLYEFKGILSQVWQRWFHAVSNPRFVDRGDASAADFTLADFTTDATWRDLSLASIVPEGAVAVLARVLVNDDAVGSTVSFRKKGNASVVNISDVKTQVASVTLTEDIIVSLDAGRIIEYHASNLVWVSITFTVKGWWL